MDPVDRGWVAGLLEGEGTFYWAKPVPKKHAGFGSIVVRMTDEDVIRKLHRVTGVGTVSGPYVDKRPNHRPTWNWQVSSYHETTELLQEILPLMGVRRAEKIRMILAGWEQGPRRRRRRVVRQEGAPEPVPTSSV